MIYVANIKIGVASSHYKRKKEKRKEKEDLAGSRVWLERHKKQNKVNKGIYIQLSYHFTVKKKKHFKKRNRAEGRGFGEKKKEEENEEAKKKKGVKATSIKI